MTRAHARVPGSRRLLAPLGAAASVGLTAALFGLVVQRLAADRMAPWVVGRAGGLLAYLLLVLLVLSGLMLSHPWRIRYRRPTPAARIRFHAALAAVTLAFTALHILALATDRYAGVGWRGAVLPLGATYRPVPVTLGVVGLWSGLAAGGTAALAGRLPRRLWWPLHKVASISLILCWLHGLLAGSDSVGLHWLYVASAILVLVVALSRYTARTPDDERAEAFPWRSR